MPGRFVFTRVNGYSFFVCTERKETPDFPCENLVPQVNSGRTPFFLTSSRLHTMKEETMGMTLTQKIMSPYVERDNKKGEEDTEKILKRKEENHG